MTMNWRKSSYSHIGGIDQGNCVEAGSNPDAVVIRDTKQKGRGPILALSREDARSFFEQIKAL